MPEQPAEHSQSPDKADKKGVSPKLLKTIRQTKDPLVLLNLCLEGGKPLLEMRPKLPRRILHFADHASNQTRADKARKGVSKHFLESLNISDLDWLLRLGLQQSEVENIQTAITTGQITGKKRNLFIRVLYFLQYYETLSSAFDSFAPVAVDDPYFYHAHIKALISDRRISDAKTVLERFRKKFAGTEHEDIYQDHVIPVADDETGFETIPYSVTADEGAVLTTRQLNTIAVRLNNGQSDEIDGWQSLEDGIIYRRGFSDTALIIYPGPQTSGNADAWTRVIQECNRLGIGQVCLNRRLDRHLTGLGPWKGRPEDTIKPLVKALNNVGIRRIATAGTSGTSLAATIAGAEINAAGALLLPAITHFPDPEKEPNPRAARAAAREYRHLPPGVYDARPYLQGKTLAIWAHLPSQSDFDCRQIDHLRDYPHLHTISHDCKSHAILPWLVEQNTLESAVSDFFGQLGWLNPPK